MSETTLPPKTDPDLGTRTPAYLAWALETLTNKKFEKLYSRTKDRMREEYAGDLKKLDEKPRVKKEVTLATIASENAELRKENDLLKAKLRELTTQVSEDLSDAPPETVGTTESPAGGGLGEIVMNKMQMNEDFENMHHATFKKKYGEKTYNKLKGASDAE